MTRETKTNGDSETKIQRRVIDIAKTEKIAVDVFNPDRTIDKVIDAEAHIEIALHGASVIVLTNVGKTDLPLFDDPLVRVQVVGREYYPYIVSGSCVELHEVQGLLDYVYVSADPSLEPPHYPDLYDLKLVGGRKMGNGLRPNTPAGAISVALQETGWTLGTVDIDDRSDIHTVRKSVLGNLRHIQSLTGGWLVFDSANKTVSLRDDRKWQEEGSRIDASGLTRIVDHSCLTRRLALWGAVTRKTFKDGTVQDHETCLLEVNEHHPYIEDQRLFSSDPRERMMYSRQINTGERLRVTATQYLSALAKPLVSYEGVLTTKEPFTLGSIYHISGEKVRLLSVSYDLPQRGVWARFGDLLFGDEDEGIFNGRLPGAVFV